MKVWQLAYPHNLQHVTAPDLKTTAGTVKVKITKALLCESDVAVYSGALKVKHPFVPGRFAIGQVTEAGEGSLKRVIEYIFRVLPKTKTPPTACVSQAKRRTGFSVIFAWLARTTYIPSPPPFPTNRLS